MNPRTLAPLSAAALAATLAPCAASAATVTLLEQERQATATIDPISSQDGSFEGFSRGASAEGFEEFDFSFEDFGIPVGDTGRSVSLGVEQDSSFTDELSGSVLLQADLFAGASSSPGQRIRNSATSSFRVTFELDEAAAFRFLGDGFDDPDGQGGDFLLADSSGRVIFDLSSDPSFSFTFQESTSRVRETGLLEPGVYTLTAGAFAGSGGDGGGANAAVELELFDSKLAGVAIPTPGALAAGLALLAAGALRRRRA